MAAACRFQQSSRLLRQCCSPWTNFAVKSIESTLCIISGARFYRGSNRDTRRRERNLKALQRKREGIRHKVFDKREFMRENYEKELFAFKSRLSLMFTDDLNLRRALTHESYEPEVPGGEEHCENNTKLALIGYNLTSHYVTEFLCFQYPSLPVEGLRCLHDFLTNRETLVTVAELTALPELIRTKHDIDTLNEEKHVDFTREDIISDAFLALIGVVYIEHGSKEATKFIQDFIITQLQGQELNKLLQFENAEKLLQNILLAEGKETPEARVTRESGKGTHLPVFVVGIFSGNSMLGEAASYNLAKAKSEATTAALMKLIQRDMQLEPCLPSSREDYRLARDTRDDQKHSEDHL